MTITPLRPAPEAPPPPSRPLPTRGLGLRAVAVITASAVVVAAIAWVVFRPRPTHAPPAVSAFLDRYVDADGRVVRRDQGGDTVSEGQSYAMLMAVAAGDGRRFARVWGWAERNLQRPDGLLSWHWENGHVVDPMPATDGDLVAAWALALAARRFDRGYHVAAQRLAGSIVANETVPVEGGLLLAAGPWARTSPYQINPSYIAPPALDALFDLTGDTVWRSLAGVNRRVLDELTAHGRQLVPDWAGVDPTGHAWPSPPPGDAGASPMFGLEAARVVLWSAMACDDRDRALAAGAQSLLDRGSDRSAARALDGAVQGDLRSPVIVDAVAAAEQAAGHNDAARRSLAEADRLVAADPRYYATAWAALARTGLTTHALQRCH